MDSFNKNELNIHEIEAPKKEESSQIEEKVHKTEIHQNIPKKEIKQEEIDVVQKISEITLTKNINKKLEEVQSIPTKLNDEKLENPLKIEKFIKKIEEIKIPEIVKEKSKKK